MGCNDMHKAEIPCSEYRPVVLIAQSSAEDLNLITEACIKFNKFDVITSTTGQSIVDNINDKCFDAVVLGLKFPDITGATVAYLVHRFDPLVSVAFLTVYSSNILIAAIQDLGFKFWRKPDKMKDLNSLCVDIYNLAIEMPCDDKRRMIKREYMRPVREGYRRYDKLTLPDSIQQVVSEREQRDN